jgi:glyoxylase-like metal-dependent hydrolase (beta-lactamase superfamily II)
MDWRIVSIGTLPSNPLWNETGVLRTGHATTTVIKCGKSLLLVDPSLPPQMLNARLQERWGIDLSAITHVFLTSFDPDRRRSLDGLTHATWLMHEPEIQAATRAIGDEILRAEGDAELTEILELHRELLTKFDIAADRPLLEAGVDLFPLPGFTPGSCGLLLPTPKRTILICGDTVATSEHVAQASVLSNCANIEMAQESFKECIEIADILVLGRDNVVLNPIRS